MLRKIGLYIQSLSLLFVVMLVLTIGTTTSSNTTDIIGIVIPIFCSVALLIGIGSFIDFTYFVIKGTQHLSVEIIKIEDMGYEPMTFISSYIIPLAFIGFNSIRSMIAFLIMLVAMGVVFLKTNMFYANPTLSLFGYKLYKTSCRMRNGEDLSDIIIISRCALSEGSRIRYIKLEKNVWFANKTI